MQLAIILSCHNQIAYTQRCLQSIKDNTDVSYKIILVDDGSTDSTSKFVRTIPGLLLLKNQYRLGHIQALNQAIDTCKLMDGITHVCLIHNDTTFTKKWASNLINILEKNPSIGAIGPVTNKAKTEQDISKGRDLPLEIFNVEINNYTEEISTTEWLDGFCLLTKLDIVRRIDKINDIYDNHYGDYNLSKQIKMKGYDLLIAKKVLVGHRGGVTKDPLGITEQIKTEAFQKIKDIWSENKDKSEVIVPSNIDSPREVKIEMFTTSIPKSYLMGKRTVDIIVPNYNQTNLTTSLIESINRTLQGVNYLLFIVDDASSEPLPNIENSNIRIIRMEQRSGFSKCVNEAMRESNSDYILVMNNDITLKTSRWLDILVGEASHYYNKAIIGGKHSTLGSGLESLGEERRLRPIYVPMWCCFIPRQVFDIIGLLDEEFSPAFYEDVDYCTRAIKEGFGVVGSYKTGIVHLGSQTIGKAWSQNEIVGNMEKSRLFYMKKHNIKNRGDILSLEDKNQYNLSCIGKNISSSKCTEQAINQLFTDKASSITTPGFSNLKINDIEKVSVVILNKNHNDLITQCLRHLKENIKYPNYEIVIGDTGTTDKNTLATYREYANFTKVINLGNYHFSKNNNIIVSQYASGEMILFLNNDVFVKSDVISQMMKYMRVSNIGITGCKMVYPNGNIQHVGVKAYGPSDILCGPGHIDRGADPKKEYKTGLAEAVTGACLMTSRKLFLELGGFAENYRNSYQDIDYCFNVRKYGKEIIIVQETNAIHVESASRNPSSEGSIDVGVFNSKWKRPPPFKGNRPIFSIITPCTDMNMYNKCVVDSLRKTNDITYEFISVNSGNKGLYNAAQALNAGICAARGQFLVLCHQDVIFSDNWLYNMHNEIKKIGGSVSKWGCIGPAGVEYQSGNSISYGHVIQGLGDKEQLVTPNRVLHSVQTLDELCIVKTNDGILFDENIGGWHFYGADICLQYLSNGIPNFAVPLMVRHLSDGYSNLAEKEKYKDFRNIAKKLKDKWISKFDKIVTFTGMMTRNNDSFAIDAPLMKRGFKVNEWF